ncbi:MAG: methyltransferase [Methanoregula sp.]|jgi:tRNA wybutosine-synthesizing protein 2|nr:methyltransferase [Methanoregula sp.]
MQVRGIPREKLGGIAGASWIDRTRRPYVEGDTAWVPVVPGEPFDREIDAEPEYSGRGFFLIGDIVIIHGRRPAPDEIGKIIKFRNPRGVLWRKALDTITRTPRVEVVWGECGETCHRESGYVYILDPSKVMFSQGNRTEKSRISQQIRDGNRKERVADMFAGIGYFTIPMAGAGATVHAMEINPIACNYLQRNAVANRLADRIFISQGDCRDYLSGIYDRIVMGHFDASVMLHHVLSHVKPGSIIHLHSIGSCERNVREIVEGAGFSCGIHVHKVKKYRPHAWHVVHDITIA